MERTWPSRTTADPHTRAPAAHSPAGDTARPDPAPSRVMGLALATPAVLLLLGVGLLVVRLDADLGGASTPAHRELVARYVLAAFTGLGCLTAGWCTPRDAGAAWLRTAFAWASVVAVPAALLIGA
ncbi:hypothetical protein ABZ383_33145 [Streptomyces sp. NPDC005900]|uniref:hypothetical protein n=1 Tax=unclassified Streptomyces TaxID=2593676 RepID=UPI0033F3267C